MIKTSSCKNCANDEVTFYSSMITLTLSTKFDFCNSIEQYAKHLNNFYVENLIKEQHIFSNVVNAWLVKSEKRLYIFIYFNQQVVQVQLMWSFFSSCIRKFVITFYQNPKVLFLYFVEIIHTVRLQNIQTKGRQVKRDLVNAFIIESNLFVFMNSDTVNRELDFD